MNEADRYFSLGIKSSKENDFISAAQYYSKAAEYNHPGAQNNLGLLYKEGKGVLQDTQKAFALFLASAGQGNTFGQRNVSVCYKDGIGTTANFDEAVSWLETAAQENDPISCELLAKYYSSGQHANNDKKMYWYEKAAEYGSVTGQLAAAEYYAWYGKNRNIQKAVMWYERAAQQGKPDIILKVAKALDSQTMYGRDEPLDLERAKYWYIKATEADDGKIRLEAAKALDVRKQYKNAMLVATEALDMQRAYFIYRQMAEEGSVDAMIACGYCYEIGKYVPKNIDIAIMWYEKAGANNIHSEGHKRAVWCRKLKLGLKQKEYERRLGFEIERINDNHLHRKEFYSIKTDFQKFYYDKRIYYINNNYLCVSDEDSSNQKILFENEEFLNFSYIAVNCTGIYVYSYGEELIIKSYSLEGKYRKTVVINEAVEDLYICDSKMYYIVNESYEEDGSLCEKYSAHWIDLKTEKKTVIYADAQIIDKIYGTDEKVILHMSFSVEREDYYNSDDGWYVYYIASDKLVCLNSQIRPPDYVINYPDAYDTNSGQYIEDNTRIEIKYFDLARDIMWTIKQNLEGEDSSSLKTVEYWEPRRIIPEYNQEIIPDIPIWRNVVTSSFNVKEYFDGINHYKSDSYYNFDSADKKGSTVSWNHSSHGECDRFTVMNGYLYLNKEGFGEEQYNTTYEESSAIRYTWFKRPISSEITEVFENSGQA